MRRHRARKRSASRSSQKSAASAARAAATRRAAIFRNGRNQAVRLQRASLRRAEDSPPQSREPL